MQRTDTPETIEKMLCANTQKEINNIKEKAQKIMKQTVGTNVYFRGIIEFSNLCEKDCFYCGIRKSNRNVKRYTLTEEQILQCAEWAFKNKYGSIVLQSGERTSKGFLDFVIKTITQIKKLTRKGNFPGLGITLSIGEQTKKAYQELFDAGAHRYLLRIETSNPKLYAKLHPKGHSYRKRVQCLKALKEIGYQVGTGVMIGLAGQTIKDLANDILFFKSIDADMIGMGPYIIHSNTPMKYYSAEWNLRKKEILQLSLNMIAATRIVLRDVNIASTTAFQALHPLGREMALEYGANIIMPIITPKEFRSEYLLYDGKPCIDEDAEQCKNCLTARITSIGRTIGWDSYGDSPHALKKIKAR